MKYLLVAILILTMTSNLAYSEEPVITKDPVLASILSFSVSGMGHIYTEEYTQGILFMLADTILFTVFAAGAEDNITIGNQTIDPDEDDGLIIIGGILLLVNRIQSAYLAHKKAESWNSKLNLKPISNREQKGLMLSYSF